MRIAFVLTDFPALSNTFVLDQITGLLERGHGVDVYAMNRTESDRMHGVVEEYDLLERTHFPGPSPTGRVGKLLQAGLDVIRVLVRDRKPGRLGSLKLGMAPARFVLRFCSDLPPQDARLYDAVHAHFGPNGIRAAAMRAGGLLSGPVLTSFHGYDLTRHLRSHGSRAYSRLFRQGDLFLPVSGHWRDRLMALGCPPEKTRVHRMGVWLHRFSFRKRSRGPDEPLRLLSIGRLVEKKGIEYGIRATAALAREGEEVSYDIVGEGPLRPRLQKLVNDLGVARIVRLCGARSRHEVLEHLAQAHLFLAPSVTAADGDQEGVPVVLMEAMASGLPVVSTFHTGIPELVAHGRTGYLVPERDVEALAGSIRRLRDEPGRWPGMGREGRRVVEERHDQDRLLEELTDLYRRAEEARTIRRRTAENR
jgi:colanic acid/amylovoran biosynthesis glycosyltransferase